MVAAAVVAAAVVAAAVVAAVVTLAAAVVFTVVAATVVISATLTVVPVEMFSADCFSAIARVMDSVLERKVVLAVPKLVFSSSVQAATTALANAVNIVSKVASKGASATWADTDVTSVAKSEQL